MSNRIDFLSTGGCLLCDEIQNNTPLSVRIGICSNPRHNVLLESDNFLFLPDISPIISGHCLLIPKKHYRSFACLPKESFTELQYFREECAALTTREFCAPVLFEHGSGSCEMRSGACVDHAHIHFLPMRAPVQGWMAKVGEVEKTSLLMQFDSPDRFGKGDYLAFEDELGISFVVTRFKSRLPCQFIRRRVAEHFGLPEWNWENKCISRLAEPTLVCPSTNWSSAKNLQPLNI